MKHNKKRMLRIIDELTMYLLTSGATNIRININDRGSDYEIIIESNYCESKRDKIENLIESLKSNNQEEVEEYCWELAGESDVGNEIYLACSMISEAQVTMEEEVLKLVLYRNK